MPTATTGEVRIEIGAPPLEVYELLSDITRMGDWSPECYRCEWLDGATTAPVGAKFRGNNRLGKARWTTDAVITAADPGREFAFTVLHKSGREETLCRYELRPNQCRHTGDRVLPFSVVSDHQSDRRVTHPA
ncbi:SRPBCC family protein [Mycolicibacterium gadium]|uniref:SRPBCC family protein n=1 Tax=Mycolicibacterium gadium TaxID=1794 RepID=A0ABT6GP21_MYCGU|nr:SRPBCC family protein [Mycolicibacterium gadium]MDG5483367.1 SRPBCC family protein [Mycolicibacterium gadium]